MSVYSLLFCSIFTLRPSTNNTLPFQLMTGSSAASVLQMIQIWWGQQQQTARPDKPTSCKCQRIHHGSQHRKFKDRCAQQKQHQCQRYHEWWAAGSSVKLQLGSNIVQIAVMAKLSRVLMSGIGFPTRLFRYLVLPTMVYGCEAWTLLTKIETRIQAFRWNLWGSCYASLTWNTGQMSTCGERWRALWVPGKLSLPSSSDGSWYGLAMIHGTSAYATINQGGHRRLRS